MSNQSAEMELAPRADLPKENNINGLERQTRVTGGIEPKSISGALTNLGTLRSLASAAATAIYDAINTAHGSDDLDHLARVMWKGYGEGAISEADATFLASCIDRRRPLGRSTAPCHARALGGLAGRVGSRFAPRPCRKRLTDEERTKRRHRKRMLGGSSAMPDTMRHHFTEGERSALCVVAGEVKRHGICDLSIDEIADRAGVGRTTTQNALHEARRHGHVEITERPQHGAKNLPNVVKIRSAEWRAWIKRGPSAARGIGSNSFKNTNTLKSIDLRKIEATDKRNWREARDHLKAYLRRTA